MDVKWKCATSGKIFPSKNKAKKFQRSMNRKDPSNIHQGLIRITVPEDKPQNISKGKLPEKKTPAKKTPKAGNRAKGTYKPSIRQDGSIFPTYEAGVIRIKDVYRVDQTLCEGRPESVEGCASKGILRNKKAASTVVRSS